MRRVLRILTVLAAALVVAVTLFPGQPASGDDRDLLRTTEAVPYVFFMLDTSASMNASVGGAPVTANGDDPRSKIYVAKRALYNVFLDATEFHYGFATYNQDTVQVNGKHWIYRPALAPTWASAVAYPTTDDLWVLGPLFTDPGNSNVEIDRAGTCADPLDLDDPTERELLNRLSRLGADGSETVTLWFTDGTDTYRLIVTATSGAVFGGSLLGATTSMDLDLDRLTSGCSSPTLADVGAEPVVFRRVTDFLHMEAEAPSDGSAGGLSTVERYVGYWPYEDALATFNCGSSSPFSGKGWEGNYDVEEFLDAENGTVVATNSSQLTGVTTSDVDPYCSNPNRCYNVLEHPTFVRDEGRNVDSGDMVPFDWNSNQHDEMLGRLNPNHNTALAPDFGIASYFQDQPGSDPDVLRLKNETRRPLIAAGGSPFAKAINDFRCWYAEMRGGQCRNARYPESWEEVARRAIGNEAGCVQPYQILITDGENICGGESPAADTAALRAQANVRTWVIALAPDGSLDSGLVNAIVNNGRGELVYAENEQELRDELQKIRSVIEEEARTFASAAVPTVQATVDDKIYVSNFTPVNNEAVWPGTVLSFLKPLPLDDQNRPDVTDAKFRWSAGEQLLLQANGLGTSATQRRVYYHQSMYDPDSAAPYDLEPVPNGVWADRRALLEAPTAGDPATDAEIDLWRGLGVTFTQGDDDSEDAARTTTDLWLDRTYAIKSTTVDGVGTVEYLLGDVFHSDPVIIGSPSNVRYFANDLNGYRTFAQRHENRRKVLLVGTNDGMLHAFDAGVADLEDVTGGDGTTFNEVKFTNGTGREIFAYVPRPMLGELRQRATTTAHDWGVDGSVRAADVYIDPVYTTSPDPDDREWRTVVVGGYRRGATGYYALDMTHPDALQTRSVGLPSREVQIPINTNTVPGCHNATGNGVLGCDDELMFPAALWEFQDQIWDSSLGQLVALDEDSSGGADLSYSWSVPNLGRLRICAGSDCLPSNDPNNPDDLEDRFVAVFGGGLPGADPSLWGTTGNHIYIVDVETGEAIYKRSVTGSVASEPAAVDTDNDGYLDRIYFGTTAGFMYRIDLVEFIDDGSGNLTQRPFPTLEDTDVRDVNGTLHMDAAQRVPLSDSDGPIWEPVQIFDTVAARSVADTTPVRRPIFLRPSVLFVAELGKYALSFGTGDREDLWRPGNQAEGRFYTFVDDSDVPTVTLPISETNLRRVALGDSNIDLSDPNVTEKNFLVDRTTFGTRGWVMVLDERERLINDPFNLSGVSFFVTFSPRSFSEAGECSREGDSRIFAVNTANANGLLRDVDKNRVRFIERKAFATAPFTEQAQTKNPDVDTEGTADDTSLGQHLEEVQEELKSLFPDNCKFGNYRIDVKTVMSDTGVVFVAPIPVCIIEKNWKEFDY